ncbi:hypothetical protein NDU88_007428 [Pleurodeles waltl]|uniref:Uncharacterized protein n=1 Tax=Pleurodeles waltl TaxID=8319 RepID=A0AAV7N6X3_PLEWA|nr:hypothetical protein NDU88_007428 [Pleurodeles waltl]
MARIAICEPAKSEMGCKNPIYDLQNAMRAGGNHYQSRKGDPEGIWVTQDGGDIPDSSEEESPRSPAEEEEEPETGEDLQNTADTLPAN